MADASKDTLYGDLSYGDETRRNGDYVSLPHDEANNTVKEGEAVTVNSSGDIIRATNGDTVVGVLYELPRSGDSGGPSDPAPVEQDSEATVKVAGTVKAVVESTVEAGEPLGIGGTSGVFADPDDGTATPGPTANFIALSGANEDDRADGTTVQFAEVRVR